MAAENYSVLHANNNVQLEDTCAVKYRYDTKLRQCYQNHSKTNAT